MQSVLTLPSYGAATLTEAVRLGDADDVRTEHDIAADVFACDVVIEYVEMSCHEGERLLSIFLPCGENT